MGTRPTKAKDNIFCKARLDAARYNDKLKSRAGAAEALGYASESTISDWELGISVPTPEAVLKMSDLQNTEEKIKLLEKMREVLRKHNVGRYLWKDDDLVEELDRALASHYPEDLDNVRRYLQNAIDHLDLIESECKAENK